MKPIYKYLIAVAVGALLTAAVTCSREEPSITTVTVTEVDTTVTEVVDSTRIKFLEEELRKAKVRKEQVVISVPDVTTIQPTDSVDVKTNKYVGTEELENGIVDYEIYADNLVATKFQLTTKDTVITNNTTTTITKVLPPKSKLFITGGYDGKNFTPQAVSLGLMYNIKQKWGVGVEVRQDFSGLLPPSDRTTLGVKVQIAL